MKKYYEYEGFPCYVHDGGTIESVDRLNRSYNGKEDYPRRGRILKPDLSNKYRRVTLAINGKTKRVFIHRLVALAYIPNPENKPCINHVDSDVTNNAVSNLEWCTASENMQHAKRMGRMDKVQETLKEWDKRRMKPVYFRNHYYESIGMACRTNKVHSRVVYREGMFIRKEVLSE